MNRGGGSGRHDVVDDRGSGAVVAVAVLALVMSATVAVLGLSAALGVRQRVIGAADAAALAAADTVAGAVPGSPCDRAAEVAAAADATLVDCRLQGAEARVVVAAPAFGVQVTARARAGPGPVDPSAHG